MDAEHMTEDLGEMAKDAEGMAKDAGEAGETISRNLEDTVEPERGTAAEMLTSVLHETKTSKSRVAQLCGKSKQYVGFVANGKADPKVGTIAEFLAAAGYEVAFVPKGSTLPEGAKVVEAELPSPESNELARILTTLTPFEIQQRDRLMQDWMKPLDGTRCPKCGAPMWVRPGILQSGTCMLNCAICGYEESKNAPGAQRLPFARRGGTGWLPGDDIDEAVARHRTKRGR